MFNRCLPRAFYLVRFRIGWDCALLVPLGRLLSDQLVIDSKIRRRDLMFCRYGKGLSDQNCRIMYDMSNRGPAEFI